MKFQLNICLAVNGGFDIFHITKLIFATFVSIASIVGDLSLCHLLLSTFARVEQVECYCQLSGSFISNS